MASTRTQFLVKKRTGIGKFPANPQGAVPEMNWKVKTTSGGLNSPLAGNSNPEVYVGLYVLKVNPGGGGSTVVAAGRNATITSLMVCCGFIICWTPNEVLFFLSYVGYPVDYGGWFYHLSHPLTSMVRPSRAHFQPDTSSTFSVSFYTPKLTFVSPFLYKLETFFVRFNTAVLVLPLHRGSGGHQQLRQPVHLRRQVPRVPAGRQTPCGLSRPPAGPASAAASNQRCPTNVVQVPTNGPSQP